MTSFNKEELIRITELYYPKGFPLEKDDLTQLEQEYERTPEHQRWCAAWEKAGQDVKWEHFMARCTATFTGLGVADITHPWHTSCHCCCVYLEEPQADGSKQLYRLVGAVSLLAPAYLVYATTRMPQAQQKSPALPRLLLKPSGGIKAPAEKLARLIEQELGCHPFPLELADVPLTHLRVSHLTLERPTLLNALFLEQMTNLP